MTNHAEQQIFDSLTAAGFTAEIIDSPNQPRTLVIDTDRPGTHIYVGTYTDDISEPDFDTSAPRTFATMFDVTTGTHLAGPVALVGSPTPGRIHRLINLVDQARQA